MRPNIHEKKLSATRTETSILTIQNCTHS